jgi:hypothetical protein
VGANQIPITPKQLAFLPVVHYWKSGSHVPDVEDIGYQMVQTIFPAGVDIDRDTTRVDQDGRRAHWLFRFDTHRGRANPSAMSRNRD